MHAARSSVTRALVRRAALVPLLAAFLAAGLPGGPSTIPVARAAETESPASLAPSEQRVENVIAAARRYLGVAYRVGAEGPSLFDCSGLVFRAFSDAGLVDRVGGSRLRAAGYMRWFARQGLMTANEEEAQRGDLVIYNNGRHIGIYLGDGRTISALLSGVTVHSLHGISQDVTGFLRPDWSGEGEVAPFVPVELPEVLEETAVLVPASQWIPALDETTVSPIEREGVERVDMRTTTTRTFENADGTFTTEFHAQPIHWLPAGADEMEPIDLRFEPDEEQAMATADGSPVLVTARSADDAAGFVTAAAGELTVSLRHARDAGMARSDAAPIVSEDGRVADYFDFQPRDVGLRLLAQPDGLATFLVLGRDPKRNTFTFELVAPGLSSTLEESGDVVLVDEAGTTVGRIPRPLLLDSSDSDGNGGGLYTAAATLEVATDEERTLLTVTVRPRLLEEAAYPAYISLSLAGFPAVAPAADVTFVSSRHADATLAGYQRPEEPGFAELWLGHQPKSRNDNEVFMRFNDLAATLGTVDVASATLELLPYWQRADDVTASARRVAGEWHAATLTWNTRPEAGAELGQITSTAGTWASLDVSEYATDILSRGTTDDGLALYGEEDAAGTWKRIAANDSGGSSVELGPRLVVTWSGLRPSPLAPQEPAIEKPAQAPHEASEDAAAAPFAWTLPQIAAPQTRFQVQVSRDGFATLDHESGTVKGRLGRVAEWTLPEDALSEAGSHEWRVRVRFGDGRGWSSWSAAQAFESGVAPVEYSAPGGAVTPEVF